MEIEEALYSYLSTHATVGGLVGTRGYPMTIPQEAKRPCWAYQVISHGEIMDHDGLSRLRTARVQFTVQANSYWDAKKLTRAIAEALRGYRGSMESMVVDSANVLNEYDGYGVAGNIYTLRLDVGLMYRATGATYISKVRYMNPTAYWTLGDASGITAADLIGLGNGAYNGCLLGQPGMGDDGKSAYFDNDDDWMQFHSARFASVFSGNLFSFGCWLRANTAAIWTDGAAHDWIFCRTDSNNSFFVRKHTINNMLNFSRTCQGTEKGWNHDVTDHITDLAGWFHLAVVCDQAHDIWKSYINGVDVSPVFTGNLSWVGTLDPNYQLVGGSIAIAGVTIHEWFGWMQHLVYFNRALTAAEVLALATK